MLIGTPALSFADLSTGYSNRVVSSGLTAGLCAGKVTCLLGPNGAGKSTLLRTLAGYQQALGGRMDDVSPETLGVVLTERMEAMGAKVELICNRITQISSTDLRRME